MKYSECPNEIAEVLKALGWERVSTDNFKRDYQLEYWAQAALIDLRLLAQLGRSIEGAAAIAQEDTNE